jgi:copper oxidase (laccase) domain-containing protein
MVCSELKQGEARYCAYGPVDGWQIRQVSSKNYTLIDKFLSTQNQDSDLKTLVVGCSSLADTYDDDLSNISFVNTDSVIGRDKSLRIAMLTADCIPLAVYDERLKVWALAHINWRGVARNQSLILIKKMIKKYDCNPSDLKAVIGPTICPECYLTTGWRGLLRRLWYISRGKMNLIKKTKRGLGFDLTRGVINNLLSIGLREENINTLSICTYHDNWPSYRRDGAQLSSSVLSVLEIF